MKNILYFIAIPLLAIWAFLFFGFHGGHGIHILLFIGLIALLLRVIQGNSFDTSN